MPQKPVEMILMRQLAKKLTLPMALFDASGQLLYINEEAERIIGESFEQIGEIPLAQWYSRFEMLDENGQPIAMERRPVLIALRKGHAAHTVFWVSARGGPRRRLEATAFPLEGQGGRHLGVVATFWESAP